MQSSSCLTPDPVVAGPFPSALTTMAFDHSRQRWFEVHSCKSTSRGRPSSVKQLRTCCSFDLHVLMAHYCRSTVQSAEFLIMPMSDLAIMRSLFAISLSSRTQSPLKRQKNATEELPTSLEGVHGCVEAAHRRGGLCPISQRAPFIFEQACTAADIHDVSALCLS